jgi:hypothetical protein
MTLLVRACLAAMLIPLGIAMMAIVTVAAGERAGLSPFGGLVPRNSAEAAGMANAAQMLGFLRQGEDPRQVHDVRPEILSSAVRRATTLEAAMWSRQIEMIELLDRTGAIPDADRRALACLAADLGVEDVVEYLAPSGTSFCVDGAALERVLARTRGEDAP